MAATSGLPPGVSVFERGWLSANNVLLQGRDAAALVDTGYVSHSAQTLSLVRHALDGRPLGLVLNTHLHSDHCGGNAALQAAYPQVQTLIPPGLAEQVRHWDPVALTYEPTGQNCPRFRADGLLRPGDELLLADTVWQIHASPGHDPHSVILFEPESRTLLSADSLWENGFGVVFPELEGIAAFDEVAGTLDRIEQLDPLVVIPGHGAVFSGQAAVAAALDRARSRLAGFVRDPVRHASHAAKVLLKFKLLDVQRTPQAELIDWAGRTRYFSMVAERYFGNREVALWVKQLMDELIHSNAAGLEGDFIVNA
jgi:glyoxylase-like metal-dependent hydrolase (beta-lactamase superfamily II)